MTRTVRRGGLSPVKLHGFTEIHFLVGCCLCGCQACYGPRGIAVTKGRAAFELTDKAADLWRRHKVYLLAFWRDPDAVPTGAGFSAAGLRGAGKWVPCFGEVKFDGAKLPKRAASWPGPVRKLHQEISDNLKR